MMNDSKPKPQYITRSVFQNLLHQALIATDGGCCGLLAASYSEQHILTQAAVLKDSNDHKTVSAWSENNLACIGLFHFEHQLVPQDLIAAVPSNYLELIVCLDEKGRLDLVAYHHDKTKEECHECPLILIEDGQSEEDA